MFINNIRMKPKLIGGFLLVALLFGLILGYSVSVMGTITNSFVNNTSNFEKLIVVPKELQVQVTSTSSLFLGHMYTSLSLLSDYLHRVWGE